MPDTIPGVQRAEPCVLVIFGASGDLAQRKLIPALYNLHRNGFLPERFAVVGVSGSSLTDEEFRVRVDDSVRRHCADCSDLDFSSSSGHRFHYLSGRIETADTYARLKQRLGAVHEEHGTRGNTVVYLATPPDHFATIAEGLDAAGVLTRTANGTGWTRLIVEKPFGHDLESARELNRRLRACLDESQIYRIDHYLGKETVQNLLAFRFLNGIFEPIWNRNYVDHVQITVAEMLGVENRGRYYDTSGALRDIVQNHVFQVLCLIAMEPPSSLANEEVRNEKLKVLRALRRPVGEDLLRNAIRGQYGPGSIDVEAVAGYREEPHVAPESATETFAALRLDVDNWRWAGVPFYVRTGKRLPTRSTQIVIQFRQAPLPLVPMETMQHANRLTIQVAPEERIQLRFQAKSPGPGMRLSQVEMAFSYRDLGGDGLATGYETLLHDCMIGERMLFLRADMVEEAWDVLTPLLDLWTALPPREFPNYAAGSWGPASADELLMRDGRHWVEPGNAT
ncbi:MAG: glucose-6-phosphate dehydrogenase [Betaproteobacteria bacterium]